MKQACVSKFAWFSKMFASIIFPIIVINSLYETLVSAIGLSCLAVDFLPFSINLVFDFSYDLIFKSLSIIFWNAFCNVFTHILPSPSALYRSPLMLSGHVASLFFTIFKCFTSYQKVTNIGASLL